MREFLARLFGRPKFLTEMARVRLDAGDVIVVSTDASISSDTGVLLQAYVQKVFGPEQKVLVLGDGLKVGVIGGSK